MSPSTAVVATLFWIVFILFLKVLDRNLHGLVAHQLDSRGITLKLFLIRYQTTFLPPWLICFTRRHRKWLRRFYSLGALVTICLVPFVCIVLVGNVAVTISKMKESHSPHTPLLSSTESIPIPNRSFRNVTSNHNNRFQKQTLSHPRRTLLHLKPRAEAVKPSGTKLTIFPHLPSLIVQRGDIALMFIALVISVLIHEMGHLLCALLYHIQVPSVGVFVAFLFPGAFVTLSNLKQHPIWIQLQIVCAGIWHNLLTIMITILAIMLIPTLSLPFYAQSGAIIITSLAPKSALSSSLSVGDIISAVAGSNLTNGVSSYENALSRLHGNSNAEPPGFCLPEKLLRQKDAACCRTPQWKAFKPSHTTRCFTTDSRAACLDAVRAALQATCQTQQDCKPNRRCARPKMYQNDRLIVLSVLRKEKGMVRVLFDGSVVQLWRSIMISNYVPRGWLWMSPYLVQTLARVDFPTLILRLLWFVLGVCVVLATSNMFPAMFLDGQLFVGLIVLLIGNRLKWKQRVVKRVETTIVMSATVTVVTNVILSVWFMTN